MSPRLLGTALALYTLPLQIAYICKKETHSMDFKMIPATIAALLLCTLPACSTVGQKAALDFSLSEEQAIPSPPVKMVNGVAITQAQVDRVVKALLAQYGITQKLTPGQLKQTEDKALDQLISDELLYQEAQKVEVKDLDRLVTEKLTEGMAKFASEDDFRKALKESGMTMTEMRETARRLIVVNNFIETRFAAKETIPEAEAKTFYDQNTEKYFKKGDRVRASHILIGADRKASPEAKKIAREKAEALLKGLQSGDDFAAVAKKESTCSTAVDGGDLGVFGKGRMSPPFEKAAYALKPGELSPVVETEYGYHIIQLKEKVAPSIEAFDEVKDKIVDFLKVEKVKKVVAAYIAELRGKAKLEKV